MDAKTIKTYNQTAKEYDDETIDFWDRFPKIFFDKFAELVKGKVLDVGSGPGRDGLILKQKGLEVVCLDASEVMVKFCEEKGLKAVLGDFNDLPFENDSFDGVWAYTSLLHIPKAEISQPIEEIKRVLKDGGIFGIGMIEGETEGYRESSGINMPRWFSFYTKLEIEELFQKHGFEIVYFNQFKPGSKNYLNFIAKNHK
ncbi:MAG: class I SAM-dependent methyltransferase [Candidatus Paceibacterota bacterium]